jgi:hypothetical protein
MATEIETLEPVEKNKSIGQEDAQDTSLVAYLVSTHVHEERISLLTKRFGSGHDENVVLADNKDNQQGKGVTTRRHGIRVSGQTVFAKQHGRLSTLHS